MRKVRNSLALVSAAATLGGWAWWSIGRPWWHSWGVDPDEAARPLAGDDLIPAAPVSETRGITIDAPPSAVWPWLVQMGYGRAGWYSYDAIDMRGRSAAQILPELQSLAVGEILPTYPGGGFEIKAVEPERSLVLYLDSQLVREQTEAAKGLSGDSPANLQAAGAFMGQAQPTEFAASWAFVLEPTAGGGTRLIERVRTEFYGGDKPWTRLTLPMMGFGVFLMVRKQLLGIRDRVESAPTEFQPASPV